MVTCLDEFFYSFNGCVLLDLEKDMFESWFILEAI